MHIDLRALHRIEQLVLAEYAFHFVRYFVIAGGAYLAFYIGFRRQMIGRKIQSGFPKSAEMRRDIAYSLLSFAVFCGSGLLTSTMQRLGWAKMYFRLDEHGWLYLGASLVALILAHDTWFYWTHRLMHWRPLFGLFHRVHHLSHNPTPWASFSFHPLEAVVQAAIFPLMVLVLPMHWVVALLWLLYMTVMNVFGHLGFEILPAKFLRSRILRWHNTSVHHNMHHRYVHCNYGLYLNVWDRLMGTNHPRYEQEYERICRTPPREATVAETTGDLAPTSSAPTL